MQTYPIEHLSEDNASAYHSFIDGLSATESFTWLYYAVDKSVDKLQETQFPADLSKVAVVTFTDGLDIGSLDEKDKDEPGKYLTNSDYRDALHTRLNNEKVSDNKIAAYTIGIIEGKGASLTTFRNNMNSLATSSANVFEVSDINNLNQIFQEIANSLSETNYVQKFVLSISGQSHNEKCKFTFDNVTSHSSSRLYIEGIYDRQKKALTNIVYGGLTSSSGTTVMGVYNENDGKYDFTFEDLQAIDGKLIPTDHVNHWFTDEGVWQDVDDEFFFNPDDATVQKIKRSAAIMLNLDCSKSMNGTKFAKLQEAAHSFVKTLVDNSIDPSEVSSVSLDKTSLSLQVGGTATLKATVLPATAKLKTVIWSSSDEAVATVDENGRVTAHSLGSATITVTTKDGGFTASCEVNVIPTPSPKNLKATTETDDITLYWSSTTGAVYSVYHSSDNINYNEIASNLSTTTYIDENPLTGANYYKVIATANNIVSEPSDYILVKFIPAPTIKNAECVGKEINLTWTSVDGASFNVYRADHDFETTSTITTGLTTSSYTDKAPISNDNYYVVTAVIDGVESKMRPSVSVNFPYINGYEMVDLGLPSGLKWATINVGALAPSDRGSYFAWGEIATKASYTQTNSILTGNTSVRFIEGDPKYDAATSNWGGTWRLPSITEFEELISNCIWVWTGSGYSVKGPNGKTIFLPAAGNMLESKLFQAGIGGYYWSSSYKNDVAAWRFNFDRSVYQIADNYKLAGISVRPVTE